MNVYLDEPAAVIKDLVQLAKLAIRGQQRDAYVFVRRLARRYSAREPALATELTSLLGEMPQAPTVAMVLRKAAAEIVPADLDFRLSLAGVEDPVRLDFSPEWNGAVTAPLQQLVSERLNEDPLLKAGFGPTRTALFTGAPGTGKTLAARWVAELLRRPLITLDLSSVMNSPLVRRGNNVRSVFEYAKSVPCVFFLDEFDAIAKRADDAVEVGELKRLAAVLQQEIDNWPASGLLIAATNHEQLLDPAALRRFETVVKFGMPGASDVRRTISMLLKDTRLSERWLKVLTRAFADLSYADIESAVRRARRQSVIQGVPLESRLQLAAAERAEALPRKERVALALDLRKAGLSQRQTHELTGVSRDTIRKHEAMR